MLYALVINIFFFTYYRASSGRYE